MPTERHALPGRRVRASVGITRGTVLFWFSRTRRGDDRRHGCVHRSPPGETAGQRRMARPDGTTRGTVLFWSSRTAGNCPGERVHRSHVRETRRWRESACYPCSTRVPPGPCKCCAPVTTPPSHHPKTTTRTTSSTTATTITTHRAPPSSILLHTAAEQQDQEQRHAAAAGPRRRLSSHLTGSQLTPSTWGDGLCASQQRPGSGGYRTVPCRARRSPDMA
jgi:hypothetical protein